MRLWHTLRFYTDLARDLLFRRSYDPRTFWEQRHQTHDFWAVGRRVYDEAGNQAWYGRLRDDWLVACQGLDWPTLRVCEIGCGTGYWTAVVRAQGGVTYTGIDIAANAVDWLRPRFPGYTFRAANVAEQPIGGPYDLIVMMHVDEHLVGPPFDAAMRHIREALAPGGRFFTTYKPTPVPSGLVYVEYHTAADFGRVFPADWITPCPNPHGGDPLLLIRKPEP